MKLEKQFDCNINIAASSNNGFIVNIGCCQCAYETKESLIKDFTEFINDPNRFINKYLKSSKPQITEPFHTGMGVINNGITTPRENITSSSVKGDCGCR